MSKSFRKLIALAIVILLSGLTAAACAPQENPGEPQAESVSGRLIEGYRILPIRSGEKGVQLTVYRGDYVKFAPEGFTGNTDLSIPALSIHAKLPQAEAAAPFFKMKKTGRYPFVLGTAEGEIRVIEFDRPQYTEVTAKEAAALIKNIQPLILDVRTPPEYAAGHIRGSVLIPLQELQQRIDELSGKSAEPILIYCATGNRSTVAAKILIDNEFQRIYNLRHGIKEWVGNGRPVVR